MSQQWYCKTAQTEFGPMNADALRKLAAKGQLSPDDQVKKGSDGHWVPVSAVKGLVVSAPPPSQPDESDSTDEVADSAHDSSSGFWKSPEVVGLGVVLACGVLLLLFSSYKLLFGGFLWPVKHYTATGYTITSANPLGKIVMVTLFGAAVATVFWTGRRLLSARSE